MLLRWRLQCDCDSDDGEVTKINNAPGLGQVIIKGLTWWGSEIQISSLRAKNQWVDTGNYIGLLHQEVHHIATLSDLTLYMTGISLELAN